MNYLQIPVPREFSPMHVAASQGNIRELLRLLRTEDSAPCILCYDRATDAAVSPLHVAADGATVRLLLATGAGHDDDEQGWTPLHQAAREGRLDAARALLDAGANLRREDAVTGEQPLHQAAQHGHAALVRLLLERGAHLEQTARGGTRPLHHASTAEVLEILLGAGADPTARDELGATALDLALQREDSPSIRMLNAVRAPVGNTPPLVFPPHVQRGLVTLEAKECEKLLPVIVIGHDVTDWKDFRQRRRGLAGSLPHESWLLSVEQQAGGYCMFYPEVLGLVLRLEDNARWALKNTSRLMRGFLAMAEDPEYPLLEREYPLLHPCTGTEGEPYPPESLSMLHAEVSRVFAFPEFDGGYEAFVRFQECDLLRVFGGWRALSLHTPPEEELLTDGSRYDSLSTLVRDEDIALTHETLLAIQSSCERFAGARLPPLRAWLLWGNSD